MPLSGIKTFKFLPAMLSQTKSFGNSDLWTSVDEFQKNPSYAVLLIRIEGNDSSQEQDTEINQELFDEFLRKLVDSSKPITIALGGLIDKKGFEIAMACHWRTAHPHTRFELSTQGTSTQLNSLIVQKIDQLVGNNTVTDLIEKNGTFDSKAALEMKLIDQIQDGDPLDAGLVFSVKHMKLSDQG